MMIKYINKINYILLFFALTVSCQLLTPSSLGETFREEKTMTIDELLLSLKSQKKIEKAQLEGTVYKTCLSEGCWFMIQDNNESEIILRIKDKKFRMPNTSADKKAIILLDAILVDTTYQKEEWYSIEVRGIKFK